MKAEPTGEVMRNGAFICCIIILNTADKQLSDFPQQSAARAGLYEMNYQWKVCRTTGHQHEVVREKCVRRGTEIWSTPEKDPCQTCFLLAPEQAVVTLRSDRGGGLAWL